MHLPVRRSIDRAASVAAAVSALGLAAACSAPAPQVDGTDVESIVGAALHDQVGGTFEASCPSPIPAVAGATVDCAVADRQEGDTVTVRVTVTDTEGAFRWEVVPPSPGPTPSGGAEPSPSAP